LVIGWGLYWLGYTPFMPTAAIIGLTNALWVVTVGAVVLALTYHYVSRHKLLYTDLLHKQPTTPKRSRARTLALLVLVGAALCCFLLGTFLNVGAVALLPFVLATLAAAVVAFR
jgi:4-hydroxybenzoate polyprenyltransferase